jgi:hypothetical protein
LKHEFVEKFMFLSNRCNFCGDGFQKINKPSRGDASCEIVEPMPLLWCIMVFLYGWFGGGCSLDKTREQNFRQWRGMSLQAT